MKDPKGPIKSYKSPEEISKKYNLPLDKIIQQIKVGTKVEGEHTTSKSGAKITALQHVDELPDYYTKLKKVEKIKEGSLYRWFQGSVSDSGKRGGAKNWGNKSEEVDIDQQYKKDTKYCLLCKKNETRDECSFGPTKWDRYSISKIQEDHKEIASGEKKGKKMVPNCVPEDTSFTINTGLHNTAKKTAKIRNLTKSPNEHERESALRRLSGPSLPLANSYTPKSFAKFMSEASAAWQRKEGKNPEGGLNAAGVASYRRQNPGSKLQTAVTTKPSKLKPGSKDAKRRKSFCARMGGVDGPMKDEKGRPTRKALALKKWNC